MVLGAKSYMTNDLLIYGDNICAFPHTLGSPSSHLNFLVYEENFVFFFISVGEDYVLMRCLIATDIL